MKRLTIAFVLLTGGCAASCAPPPTVDRDQTVCIITAPLVDACQPVP